MAEGDPLSDLELALPRALVLLADNAEDVTIHGRAEQLMEGRPVLSLGAVCAALAGLERKGFVTPSVGGPALERSRRSPHLRIRAAGEVALESWPVRFSNSLPDHLCPPASETGPD